MQTIEYRFRDKAKGGRGPWQLEADKKQWQDEATGLPCLIVRGPGGALCGYVGVDDKHQLYGLDYYHFTWSEDGEKPLSATQEAVNALSAHGGLTYAAACASGEPEHGICHIPDADEPDHVWWFGFDCAHSGDVSPMWDAQYSDRFGVFSDGIYRSQSYVEAECASLARQLAATAR